MPRWITGIDLSVVNSFANVAAFVWLLWLVSWPGVPDPQDALPTSA